jgi:hypothetical protein
LNWIGIDPISAGHHPRSGSRRLMFRHFLYLGEDGPLLEEKYPALARHMYDTNRRSIMHHPSPAGNIDQDVRKILRLAKAALPSKELAKRGSSDVGGKCRVRPAVPVLCSPHRRPSKS